MEYTKESFILASFLFGILIITIINDYHNANKSEKLIEGFKDDPIVAGIKKAILTPMIDGVKKAILKPMMAGIKKAILNPIMKPINKIMGFFTYLGKFFTWIGDIIKCSIETIIGLPNCFIFYMFDLFIGFLTMMIKFFCSFSPALETARKTTWQIIMKIDKMVYSISGFHIVGYPKSVIKMCYKCQNVKMPKMKL
jgi:hypothetical protein